MQELQERLIALEIRFTHQARQVEELNAEVIECHRRLSRLERENRSFREMLKALSPSLPESPDE